ncbi:hypothetical protein [Acinetobacter gerneri]|jgi:hypothetical protein|uniref:hypothetical protein n=1 Tax=Acinetobacter gerneri TaxID=202952 RepID=UPI0023F02CB0|nr:hypothetical protein [Acinetobacter gerneri]MCH4243711.1 hypothetical protein [Acinetobacter gerneri]
MSKNKQLPHHISTPFMHWMFNGGHSAEVKTDCVVLRKNKNIGKIFCDGTTAKSYLMNNYCAERYEMFLKQYFNNGKSFIDALNLTAAQRYAVASANNQLQVA